VTGAEKREQGFIFTDEKFRDESLEDVNVITKGLARKTNDHQQATILHARSLLHRVLPSRVLHALLSFLEIFFIVSFPFVSSMLVLFSIVSSLLVSSRLVLFSIVSSLFVSSMSLSRFSSSCPPFSCTPFSVAHKRQGVLH
jgi:hypothetical protein